MPAARAVGRSKLLLRDQDLTGNLIEDLFADALF
jgi:hypothetical protein